jgi:hypothetical protein
LNAGYRFGGWGKDSKLNRGFESMYWYGAYSSASVNTFDLYSNYQNLVLRNLFKQHTLANGWQGTGNN